MGGEGERGSERRRAWMILAFATVGFFALLIFALGMASFATGEAVIAEPGLGPAPGVLGTIGALTGFVVVTGPALMQGWTGLGHSLGSGAAAAVGYAVGVLVGSVFSVDDPLRAGAVAGSILVSWVSLVIAGAAALSAAGAAVAVRAGPGIPRWPWERDG